MNTAILHKSSLGRIYLLTKASLTGTLRTFLVYQMIMAIAFFIVPFFFQLITNGFDVSTAYSNIARSYKDGELLLIYGFATWMYCLIWINQLVHHSNPTVFTQIPASVGEKISTIAIASVLYHLVTFVAVMIITWIFSRIAPGELDFFFTELGSELARGLEKSGILNVTGFVATWIFGIVMPVLCMLYFRRALFGLCAIGIITVILTGLVSSQIIHVFYMDRYTSIEDIRAHVELLRTIYLCVTIALDVAISYGIYYRLKTIQLK